MATGIGNYLPIETEDLLARLSHSDEETNDSDDSFDIIEVGMDTELDEVSFICESSDNGNNGSNDDEDNSLVAGSIGHYNISLPGSSTALVSSSKDSNSSNSDSGDSRDFSDTVFLQVRKKLEQNILGSPQRSGRKEGSSF